MSKRPKEVCVENFSPGIAAKVNVRKINRQDEQKIVDVSATINKDFSSKQISSYVSNLDSANIAKTSGFAQSKGGIIHFSNQNLPSVYLKEFANSTDSVIFPEIALPFVDKNKVSFKLTQKEQEAVDRSNHSELSRLFNYCPFIKVYSVQPDPDTKPSYISSEIPLQTFNQTQKILFSREPYYQPDSNYIIIHEGLEWKDRFKAILWLMNLYCRFNMNSRSLFVAVNMLDRFLSLKSIKQGVLKHIAFTCCFIASKMESQRHQVIDSQLEISGLGLTPENIKIYERYILSTLDFNLECPTPYDFLSNFDRMITRDQKTKLVARYILELATLDTQILTHPPSVQAAAALSISRKFLNKEPWILEDTNVPYALIIDCASLMLDLVLNRFKISIYDKYAEEIFLQASVLPHTWYIDNRKLVQQLEKNPVPHPSSPLKYNSHSKRFLMGSKNPTPQKLLPDKSDVLFSKLQKIVQDNANKSRNTSSSSLSQKSFSRFV